MSNRYIEVRPQNNPSDGFISYKNGNPQITFLIGEQNAFLLGKTIRLSGKFHAYSDAAKTAPHATQAINGRIGVYSILDQVILRSNKNKATIEHIRDMNRLMSSYFSVTAGKQDGISHLNTAGLIMPNFEVARTDTLSTTGEDFCIHIPTGLLNGTGSIPLSSDYGIGGCELTIMLAPDSSIFYSNTGTTTNIVDCWYELSDVRLSAELEIPPPDQLSQLMRLNGGTLEYNSISSQYATINSGNGIVNFSLGLSKVQSVFVNMIPAKYLNNLAYDSMATLMPMNTDNTQAGIKTQTNTRAGVRYPREFVIDGNLRTSADTNVNDPEMTRNYVNAIAKWTNVNPETYLSSTTSNRNYTGAVTSYAKVADGGPVMGLGVTYDQIGSGTADFSNVQWGLEVDSNLTSDEPQAFFIYAVNKNTLVFNKEGLQVIN
jgi:hypothetical protein